MRATRTFALSVPDSSGPTVDFDSEAYDTQNLHSTITQTSVLTAPRTGNYVITGGVVWNATGDPDGRRILAIYVDATSSQVAFDTAQGMTTSVEQTVTTVYRLSAGDPVQMFVNQNSGSTLSIGAFGSSAFESPFLGMTWVGP